MKRQIGKILRRLAVTACAAIMAIGSLPTAFAEDNTGTGDVNGDAAALADSNVFQLFSTGAGLALVKTAWITSDGSPITSGSTVPQGTSVDFMIYVNNQGSVDINDVSIQDVLDPLFVYNGAADSIRVLNVNLAGTGSCNLAACTPAEEAAIYAAVSADTAKTNGTGDDEASFNGTDTIDVGNENEGTNTAVTADADRVLAVVFTVQVQ
jgi:uncharacterized repeat protein (TIGR01451 family)